MTERDTTYPVNLVGRTAPPPEPADPDEVVSARRAALKAARNLDDDDGIYAARTTNHRPAGSLMVLLEEADATNPGRDRASDGGIGDARHAADWFASDHNPWLEVDGVGVVRARDFDGTGLDVAGAFERARAKAAAGHLPQLIGGGYLIYNRRITTPDFAEWREYQGSPHVLHGHVSVSRFRTRFDDRRAWGIWTPPQRPATPPKRPAQTDTPARRPVAAHDATGAGLTFRAEIGDSGPKVEALQAFLRRTYPRYARDLDVDGDYGPETTRVLCEFARRSAIRDADGRNVGPRIARKLYIAGFRP
jgi:hypothetical protein